MINIDNIQNFFRGKISLSEPMKKYTSFRIGGVADYYFEPMDKEDTVNIVTYLQNHDISFIAIGKGTNILVSDDGFRGAVINIESSLKSIYAEGSRIVAEAGVSLNRLVDFCIQRGMKGIEMLAGIPGTIGGAVIMNAGAFGGEISTYLIDAEIIRNGTIIMLKKEDIVFEYRRSSLQAGDVVISASFLLPAGNRDELMKIRNNYIIQRNKKHPVILPNCGSVFKNPTGLHAAKIIEDAGLKGTKIGNAQISELHANFIVNHGNATAKDVFSLIELVRQKVKEKLNIELKLEVKLLGFPEFVEKEIIP